MGAGYSVLQGNAVNSDSVISKGVNVRDFVSFSDDCYEGETNAAFVYAIVAFSVMALCVVMMVVNL